MIPWVDEGKVVRTHLADSVCVFIHERCGCDGVVIVRGRVVDSLWSRYWRCRCVDAPDIAMGCIPHCEEECLHRVREPDVVNGVWIVYGCEGLTRSCLDLLNEDISGRTTHSLPLFVADNRVIGPYLDIIQFWRARDIGAYDWHGCVVRVCWVGRVIQNEEFVPVPEIKGDLHLVIRQSSRWESDAGVAREEERKWEIESLLGEGNPGFMRGGKAVYITDHVVIPDALTLGDRERGPKVEMIVIESSSDQIVKGNTNLSDQVVHKVFGPANSPVGPMLVVSEESDLWNHNSEPRVQKVIRGATDGHGPFLIELRMTRAS